MTRNNTRDIVIGIGLVVLSLGALIAGQLAFIA
jgi:hypothetical protein